MKQFLNKKEQKESSSKDPEFICDYCDFKTSRQFNLNKHFSTKKHILNCFKQKTAKEAEKYLTEYICKKCDKKYKNRSGLWHHKNKCHSIKEIESKSIDDSLVPENFTNINVIYELIKQNNEFKTLLVEQNNKIMELAKEKSMTVNNNNNTINNNQKFNMNFFLNEQCKGALDIMDFVNSLKVQLTDLENTGNVGYVKGISDIFLRGLNELDIYKRPIHCSDLKREVIYVKDNDVWEKDEDKKKIKKVIQNIANKNFKQINEWIQENPEANDIQTKKHDQYIKILMKCTGGTDILEDDVFYNKIITNVAKEVQIDK